MLKGKGNCTSLSFELGFLFTIFSSIQVFPDKVPIQYISRIKSRLFSHYFSSLERYLLYAVYILKINKVSLLTFLKLGKICTSLWVEVKVGFTTSIDPK